MTSFQSTTIISHFYPRPPRGGRLDKLRVIHAKDVISIHALREEGDRALARCWLMHSIFLSTPSARRATTAGYDPARMVLISIHALREEGDQWLRFWAAA